MAKDKLNRIIRPPTKAEKRRHQQIREATDREFVSRRKTNGGLRS